MASFDVSAWLESDFAGLVADRGVPGAAVAVLADGRLNDAAAGVLSLSTGVAATTDSVFQIGSVTKLWTSTLVMQLVDDGCSTSTPRSASTSRSSRPPTTSLRRPSPCVTC